MSQPPQRIISLVPSQTELLYDLGLEEEVVGITKFCIHPGKWFRNKTRVGGTKTLHIDVIDSLQPDLIIANKEENVKEQVELLSAKYPVYTSDIHTLPEALEMISTVGHLTGTGEKATKMAQQIERGFRQLSLSKTRLQVAYLIWRDPYMTVGSDTFIHDMITRIGWQNIFENKTRYPECSVKELLERKPDVILLSSEPYPFKQKHIDELQQHFPGSKIAPVDGELFSWYGSRLLKAPAYFRSLQQEIGS